MPPAPPEPWANLSKVLALASRPNAVIKISGACTLSREPYPFADIWDPLARIFDAWGFDRCLWGTDWTRAFAVVNYEQAVEPFLRTDRLSDTERAMLMGGACAKAYGWSPKKVSAARRDRTGAAASKGHHMTIQFEKLKARLLANPKVKAEYEYDALAPEFEIAASCSGPACAQACRRPSLRPGWAPANPPSRGLKMVTRFRAPRRSCATQKPPAAGSACGYRRLDASAMHGPDERGNIRGLRYPFPAYRCAHAGYLQRLRPQARCAKKLIF